MSRSSSRRRNLPQEVAPDRDYHDVRVDYRLTNRLADAPDAARRDQDEDARPPTASPAPDPPAPGRP